MEQNSLCDNENRFKDLFRTYVHRDGVENLLAWLTNETDFFKAPSSAKYHGCVPGGLCAHSLKVYDLLKEQQEHEPDESLVITALLHDLCKINTYSSYTKNVKSDDGTYTKKIYYVYDEQSIPLGHGEKSMFLAMRYLQLTDEEACAIRWHMGAFAANSNYELPALNRATSKYKLVLKLQIADQKAASWYNC